MERAQSLLNKPLEVANDGRKNRGIAAPPNSAASRKVVGRSGSEYFLLDTDEILAFQAEGEMVWIVTSKQRLLATQTLR